MHVNENIYYITLWHYHKAISFFFFLIGIAFIGVSMVGLHGLVRSLMTDKLVC